MKETNKQVVCFGEVLWDNLPSGRKPGGAPMNVAYHLSKLGIKSTLISRVGNDADGRDLLAFLNKIGLSTCFCQVDKTNPTSTTVAIVNANHDIHYDICYPVAWDFIEPDDRQLVPLIKESEALVFGSLSVRNNATRNTLHSLLENAGFKVLDINLRQPYYRKESLSDLLRRTNLLKLNSNELVIIAKLFNKPFTDERDSILQLQDRFQIGEVLVTRGNAGCSYYQGDIQYTVPAYNVIVNDTVGSGDSFLAAFIAKRLCGKTIIESLQYATALAAFVTSRSGACPPYNLSDLELFIAGHTSTLLNTGI